MLRAGIVGLPNVGKSTLFNAITRTRKAEAANYPFCTIDPNIGMVTVPDARLQVLQQMVKTNVVIPAVIEFVDIAGLVKGASQGEGLGNKFLTHIREVDAIVQVVRCFEDADVHHVSGDIDPVRDIEVINTELMLADLETVKKRRERIAKEIKRGDKSAAAEDAVLVKIETSLDAGKPALTVDLTPEEHALSSQFFLLSDKRTIFACNVKESDLATADQNPYVLKVREYRKNPSCLRSRRHQRPDRKRSRRPRTGRSRSLSQGAGRARKRHRRADPRDLSPARLADLSHRRRKRSARLDHP